jgi:D-beta-D-heptose 7-phosphate kinase/D-beta-D-heptose 1-phosphate adenosyltransferase
MIKIWVNGTFDVLHRGHLELLKFAKSQGDWLCVGIDSDQRIKELKGNDRPINYEEDRKMFLESLKFIDEVIIFNTREDLCNKIKDYNPGIFVIGSDYINKEIIGKEYAKRIIFFNRIEKYSSSSIIKKIKEI